MTVVTTRPPAPILPVDLRDTRGVAELFLGVFRRDVAGYFPQSLFEPMRDSVGPPDYQGGMRFRLIEAESEESSPRARHDQVEFFGVRYAIAPRCGGAFSAHDRRMIRAIGAVLGLRFHHLFQNDHNPRLELYRGGSEDHHIAAFIEPTSYTPHATRPSRIASTLLTLRTAALSTYENRRVSTGALILGGDRGATRPEGATPPDALAYDVELTSLKSLYRLCDGRRTVFLVDRDGRLAEIIDIERWASRERGPGEPETPCARTYAAHALATLEGGDVCLLLSPNQEIKIFAGGVQAFAFAHGRWRMLDPQAKYAAWRSSVANERVARVLFQSALDLAESRQGGLLVVVNDPPSAVGALVAPHDLLDDEPDRDAGRVDYGLPLPKRALHYLARGRDVATLDPSVLEALGGLDGALVTGRDGRLLAFGAILRHDASHLPATFAAEGARTTAAVVASRFGPVLKVSEDGVISFFLDGVRVWDL